MTNAGLRTLWRCRSTRSPMATAAWCFALFLGHTTGQDCPTIEPAAAAVDVYPYETLAWYQELKASPARTVTLLQADFANGTYRISEPGRYVLAEDVDFGPLPDNDYWPRENDPAYPQGAWFLGFWAAVTIETDDVWLDLAGHTLRMSSAFHLRQRFFNLVELADRVFDSHEGVASLNLQTNDRLQFGGSAHDLSGSGRTHGAPRHARRCIVSNGVLGLSSHNGLHSNWGSDLVFEDLVIRDFEVAGVQLNGVDRVGMRRVQVGPNLQTMPAYAALSNARFLELYTRRFIPAGFARLGPDHSPQLLALLDEQTISYARAPDARLSLRAVFARLHRALQLWYAREDAEGDAPLPSNADDVALLAQAEARFRNPTGLADGSAVYGIRFHRRGAGTGALGEQDQNYRGPEHFNISMRDCVVSDLRARPLMVPALLTPDGTVVQGPVRDVLDLLRISSHSAASSTSGLMRTLHEARYAGDFLSDAYAALWQLSNAFYTTYVVRSQCGNFGSNLTAAYAPCDTSVVRNDLFGRQVSMLQKRFFGGLTMTQRVYEWMTDARFSLEDVLGTREGLVQSKQLRHQILCNGDAMFHNLKGVIGIQLGFVADVLVSNTTVTHLMNSADKAHWLCGASVKLLRSGELLRSVPLGGGPSMAADVRGLRVGLSERVVLRNSLIDGLHSVEGPVYGIDLSPDSNDRSDWEPQGPTVTIIGSAIGGDLRAGTGARAVPLRSAHAAALETGGLKVAPAPPMHNQLDAPRASLLYGIFYSGDAPAPAWLPPGARLRRAVLAAFGGDEAAVLRARRKAAGFFEQHYGLHLAPVLRRTERNWERPTLLPCGSVFTPLFVDAYRLLAACRGEECAGELAPGSRVDDLMFLILPAAGLVLHGTFGGEEGVAVSAGEFLLAGTYLFRGDNPPFVPEGGTHQIDYYGTCPVALTTTLSTFLTPFFPAALPFSGLLLAAATCLLSRGRHWLASLPTQPVVRSTSGHGSSFDTLMINCHVESDVLGRGHSAGSWQPHVDPRTGQVRHVVALHMAFDDIVPSPDATTGATADAGTAPHPGTASPRLAYVMIADGILPSPPAAIGAGVHPLSTALHYGNEAGVAFLRGYTPIQTEDELRAFRRDFLDYLRDSIGVERVLNRPLHAADYWDEPVDNALDFGGGNVALPYALTEGANLHVSMRAGPGGGLSTRGFGGSRAYEGGFKMQVGRAGLWTARGYLPYGSLVRYGFYSLHVEDENSPRLVRFEDIFAHAPSTATHFEVLQRVVDDELGEGVLSGLALVQPSDGGGTQVGIRLTMQWLPNATDARGALGAGASVAPPGPPLEPWPSVEAALDLMWAVLALLGLA